MPLTAGREATSAPGSARGRHHVPALDGIRGTAILLVLVWHALDMQLQPLDTWKEFLVNVACSTAFGVQLFFVLSGFLITGILLDAKGSRNYFRNFYGRRALRILPLYYGTIVVFGAALHASRSIHEGVFYERLPWLLTFTQNFLMTASWDWSFIFGNYSLGHFWSLAVEEQFYLVWPMVVLWCPVRTIKRICFVLIPVALAARIAFIWGGNNELGASTFFLCAVDSLAMGALLAVYARERERAVTEKAWPMFVLGGLLWLACCVDKDMLITLGISGFCLMCTGLLAAGIYRGLSLAFSHTVLRAFGKYSYAIYVLHVPLLAFILPLKATLGSGAFTVLLVLLSYIAGWLSWRLYEVHFLRLKAYLPLHPAEGEPSRPAPQARY